MLRWRIWLCWVAILLGGCASTSSDRPPHGTTRADPHGGQKIGGWPLEQLVAATGERAMLATDERPVALIRTRHARAAWAAAQRLLAVMPLPQSPTVLITEGRVPNAFVFVHDRKSHVAANVGMVDLLGDDEAAWAALFGHELAHLTQRHRDTRAERQVVGDAASGLLGAALSLAGVPLGALIAESATTLVERGYTRDEERDADRLGVAAMVQAGYDPAGAVRLQERLAAAGGDKPLPFLSTHPSGSERVEAMRVLAKEFSTPVAAPAVQSVESPPAPTESRTPAMQ